MKTISKYLVPRLPLMALAILMLIMQAWCDLSLPGYTSSIVDVGIASGGVEDSLPLMLSGDDYMQLWQADPALAQSAYQPFDPSAEGYDALAKRFPDNQGAYHLVSPQKGLEPLMESLYLSQGAEVRYGSAMTSYIIQCYSALGLSPTAMQMGYILRVGGRMLSMVLLSACAAICLGYVSSYVGASLSRDLRRDIYGKVLSFSPSEFHLFSTASLITRSTNDIQQVQMMAIMSLRMVSYAPIMAIGGIIKVVNTNASMWWIIALAACIIIMLLAILFSATMPRFKLLQTLVDKLNLVSREVLTGLPVIRAFGAEKREIGRFEQANDDLMKTGMFVNRTMSAMMPAMNLVMNGTTLLIVWIGAGQIGQGVIQVGDMMAFITYATQIIMAFLMLGMMSVSAPRAFVSVGRIAQVLETQTVVSDPPCPILPDGQKPGVVEFSHVDFKYPGGGENVLSDISFTAMPGQTTAIIGSTGCGKTTLVSLIPRFFDVTGGHVYVEGVDVRDMPQKELRSKIGFVPQKSVLFSGTIAGNIAFSDGDMPMEDVEAAACTAQAMEFINQRPEGFDAAISQGGSNVSGGQKQRLAIARALAKKAPIYIFDDSFSALDYKTDRSLRRALGGLTQRSALLIVAQRISTVMDADKIIVLDEGKIAGMGTHRELMASCEEYRQIALSQLSKEELANG